MVFAELWKTKLQASSVVRIKGGVGAWGSQKPLCLLLQNDSFGQNWLERPIPPFAFRCSSKKAMIAAAAAAAAATATAAAAAEWGP